jgi:hypothetical protein
MEVIEIKQYDELPNALRNIDINFKRIMASITQLAKKIGSSSEEEESSEPTPVPPPVESIMVMSSRTNPDYYYPGTTWQYMDIIMGDGGFTMRAYKRIS